MSKQDKIKRGFWYTLLFSIAGIIFIFQGTAKESLRVNLKSINFGILGIGFLALLMVWLSKSYRVYAVAQGMGQKVSMGDCLQIYLAVCFISHVTPFNAGGTPFQIYLLYQKGINIGKATAITTIDLGLHLLTYLMLAVGTLFYNIGFFKKQELFNLGLFGKVAAVFVLLGVNLAAIGLFYRLKHGEKIKHALAGQNWFKRLQREFLLFKEGSFSLIRGNLPKMLTAILASIAYWFFYLMLAPIILWAMGKSAGILGLIYAQLFFNIAQTLIPTPGGSGGSELLLSYLFRDLIGLRGAGAFVLIWRIYTFFSTLALGGFCFWKLTVKGS